MAGPKSNLPYVTAVFIILFLFLGAAYLLIGNSSKNPLKKFSPTTECVVGGCSGTLCIDKREANNAVTTCEWREEYGCYKNVKCEVQSNGNCGFTKTQEFENCISSAILNRQISPHVIK